MNIDISNAHCGPRILFLDHSWLRVVSYTKTARFPGARSRAAGKRRSALDARRDGSPHAGRRRGVPNRESGAPEKPARETTAPPGRTAAAPARGSAT